ncbi:MAG: hypothetical protein ACREMD_00595, partial [Gemmatimonadota bacterium]
MSCKKDRAVSPLRGRPGTMFTTLTRSTFGAASIGENQTRAETMSSAGSLDVLERTFLFCAGMLSALLLIGCSEEDPAGIDFNNVLDGRWTYSVTGLELPDGRVCGISSAVLDLE